MLNDAEWCGKKFNDLSSIIRTTNLCSTKLDDAESVWPRTKAPDAMSSNIVEYIFAILPARWPNEFHIAPDTTSLNIVNFN